MKTTIDEIIIKGITYVPKRTENKSKNYKGNIKIVILQRGWIYIGRFSKKKNLCKLENSFCIRNWGTTKGLQELVHGPTNNTKLDKCEGIIEFDWLTVVHTISVEEDKWKQI